MLILIENSQKKKNMLNMKSMWILKKLAIIIYWISFLEGAVFGVALETLLRKDMILWEETWSSVPSILRALSSALRSRTKDEGLLRVPGNKHKVIY